MAKDGKRPAKTLRCSSGVKAVIWKNEGEHGARYSVQLRRTYRTEDGEFKDADSVGRDELLVAAHALERAYDWINDAVERERREQNEDE